jgi:hypothetical protein
MPVKRSRAKEHVHYHNDGTIWAKGQMIDGVMTGYWEWFRKDGTRMRSGHFENGEQIGEWTTYDRNGEVVKVTTMKKPGKSKRVERVAGADDPIAAYSQAQPLVFRGICDHLRDLIDRALHNATAHVWHGSPVWFIDDNPVVGYNATAKAVNLLFWNGQAFDEPDLKPVGKYRAAQAMFRDAAEIDPKVVRRWLKKAKLDVLDSKALFRKRREGKRSHV